MENKTKKKRKEKRYKKNIKKRTKKLEGEGWAEVERGEYWGKKIKAWQVYWPEERPDLRQRQKAQKTEEMKPPSIQDTHSEHCSPHKTWRSSVNALCIVSCLGQRRRAWYSLDQTKIPKRPPFFLPQQILVNIRVVRINPPGDHDWLAVSSSWMNHFVLLSGGKKSEHLFKLEIARNRDTGNLIK